jgi:FkbM family methyltransferase
VGIVQQIKFLGKLALRREVYYKKQVSRPIKWFGNKHAGFFVVPGLLNKESIVYSFGVGEDISFDEQLIAAFGCTVYGFDPTPKSIKFIEEKGPIKNYTFLPFGIADVDGVKRFFLPENPAYVSGTFLEKKTEDDAGDNSLVVPVKKFSTIVKALGHNKIDVLKLDIEGSEYSILDDIFDSKVQIGQILIEFHHRFQGVGIDMTHAAISKINKNGFFIAGISEQKEEYTFVAQ